MLGQFLFPPKIRDCGAASPYAMFRLLIYNVLRSLAEIAHLLSMVGTPRWRRGIADVGSAETKDGEPAPRLGSIAALVCCCNFEQLIGSCLVLDFHSLQRAV
jgi:hypothetical protein